MQHYLQLRAVANGERRRASLALVGPSATLSLASAVALTGGTPDRRKNGDPLRFRVRDEADRVDDAGHGLEMLNRVRRTLRPIRRQGGSEFQAAAAARDRRDGRVVKVSDLLKEIEAEVGIKYVSPWKRLAFITVTTAVVLDGMNRRAELLATYKQEAVNPVLDERYKDL